MTDFQAAQFANQIDKLNPTIDQWDRFIMYLGGRHAKNLAEAIDSRRPLIDCQPTICENES